MCALTLLCHAAVLGRWLQLYMLGDPESAEAELADELAGIYRDALPSARGGASHSPSVSRVLLTSQYA